MLNKIRNIEDSKIKLGKGRLAVLSMIAFGSLVFPVRESVKAAPGILGKRSTPSGGYSNLTNPPPIKRRIISMSRPSNYVFYGLEDKDAPWFNQGIVRGSGSTTVLSLTEPKPLAGEVGYHKYLIFDYVRGFHTVAIKNHTGWHKGRDIIWIDND